MPTKALYRGMLTILNTLFHLTFDLAFFFFFHLIELIAARTQPEKHKIRERDIYFSIHISILVNFNISNKKNKTYLYQMVELWHPRVFGVNYQ